MVADGWLGQVERRCQVADAHLAALVRADQGHQPQPDRVAECPEHLGKSGGRNLIERLAYQRNAADLGGSLRSVGGHGLQDALISLYRHNSILTAIDQGWQAGASCIDVHRWRTAMRPDTPRNATGPTLGGADD